MAKKDDAYLGLRVTSAFKAEVEQRAAEEDRSVANWIERLIARELKRLASDAA